MKKITLTLVLLIPVIVKILLSYDTTLTTADDFLYLTELHKRGFGGYLQFVWDSAVGFSRFSSLYQLSAYSVPFMFHDNLWFFCARMFGVLIVCLSFHRFLTTWWNQTVANFSILFFCASFFLGLDHHISLAYPFVFHTSIALLLCGLTMLRKNSKKAPVYILIYGLITALGCSTYEVTYLWLASFVLIFSRFFFDLGIKKSITFFSPSALYLIGYVLFPILYKTGPTYAGAKIKANAVDFLTAFKNYSLGAVVQYQGALEFNFGSDFILTFVLFGTSLVGLWSLKRILENTESYFDWRSFFVGVSWWLLPAVIVAITPKYQLWAKGGSHIYVVTFFSQLGLSIVLANTVLYAKKTGITFALTTILLGLFSIQAAAVSNRSIETLRKVQTRIEIFESLVKELDPNSCYETNMFEPIEKWNCCHPVPDSETFWTDWAKRRLNKDIQFYSGHYLVQHPELKCIKRFVE